MKLFKSEVWGLFILMVHCFFAGLIFESQLVAFPTGSTPSTNLAIDFTNKGDTKAYIRWSLPPGLSTSPSSVNFGTVNIGQSSAINLVILNDGTALIQLQPMSVAGQNASDFTFVSQCSAYLDSNAQCTVVITFKPSAPGPRSATLSIPFAGVGLNPPSMQIILTKLEPPTELQGKVR